MPNTRDLPTFKLGDLVRIIGPENSEFRELSEGGEIIRSQYKCGVGWIYCINVATPSVRKTTWRNEIYLEKRVK